MKIFWKVGIPEMGGIDLIGGMAALCQLWTGNGNFHKEKERTYRERSIYRHMGIFICVTIYSDYYETVKMTFRYLCKKTTRVCFGNKCLSDVLMFMYTKLCLFNILLYSWLWVCAIICICMYNCYRIPTHLLL